MVIYYVKQYGLYYGGTTQDGVIRFANVRSQAVALATREAAEIKANELGREECEIEERVLGPVGPQG